MLSAALEPSQNPASISSWLKRVSLLCGHIAISNANVKQGADHHHRPIPVLTVKAGCVLLHKKDVATTGRNRIEKLRKRAEMLNYFVTVGFRFYMNSCGHKGFIHLHINVNGSTLKKRRMSDSGIVARRTKGFYYLITDNGRELECKVKGLLYKDSRFDNQIAVGDRVFFIKAPADDVGLITGIDKRKSFLSRNRVGVEAEQIIAANIDYLFIVASVKAPPFRINLVTRLIVAATIGNITPLLVLTKTDLANDPCIEQLLEPYRSIQLEIIQTSIKNDAVDPRLMHLLSTGTSVLSGQSGVGKSSLLNKYFPDLQIKVGAVSSRTAKGSHTTTYANLHRIGETGFVIDTPGIREFGLWGIRRENLGSYYPLIDEIGVGCKHRNCHHIHEPEPDCAVKIAVVDGVIHQSLYRGYRSIYESLSR